jgi:putative heme iron utilization protein
MSRAAEARRVVRAHRSGVLSTHSVKYPGYPHGSALPHVADAAGRPVVLISELAEHTQNILADPRVSFLVAASGADVQAQARVTVLGDAAPVADPAALQQRYWRFYPEHARYLQLGGFRLYAIEPRQVRYIQGFGSLHWLAGDSYLAPASLADAEVSILAHMNEDHRDALREYCRHVHRVDAAAPEMVGVDCDGFDVRSELGVLRFDFEPPVNSPGEVRARLVELARQARNG